MKAIYARISEDAEETQLGVQRQIADCSKVADLRGWQAEEYVDNNLSAFRRGVVRPEFERMLGDLRDGQTSGLIVYNLDRLARQPGDLERLITIYEARPELTFGTVEGDINLASDDGMAMARVMVTFANKASKDTGRRTRRKHLELAEQGEPVGRRMFGWEDDKRTLHPEESERAREVVRDLLAGAGVRDVVRRLNDAGVTTTTGGAWSHQSLRKYLRNPRLIGLRTRHGEVLYDEQQRPVKGTWEPLLDQETYDRVQALLDGRSVAGRVTRRGARKYLLTGLLRCGICNGLMFGSKAREEGRFNYVCNVSSKPEGERHTLAASGTEVDRVVDRLTFELAAREGEKREVGTWPREERAADVEAQVSELMAAYDSGELAGRHVFPRVTKLEEELSELRAEKSRWLVESAGPSLAVESVEQWEAMTADQKRQRMDQLWAVIYVRPATRRSGRFDAGRLDAVPR